MARPPQIAATSDHLVARHNSDEYRSPSTVRASAFFAGAFRAAGLRSFVFAPLGFWLMGAQTGPRAGRKYGEARR